EASGVPSHAPVKGLPLAAPPSSAPRVEPTRAVDSRSSAHPTPKWVGWTATGVGAAGLVAGAVMGALALDRLSTVHDVCPQKQCRDESGIDASNQGKAFVVGSI